MNKKLKITSYILAFLVAFYILMKFTGICVFYTIPVTSSEPTIKEGSYIIASNLITHKRGDFITYNFNHPELGKATWIHRLCGVENDTIQLVDGVLFVNGNNFDVQYNLQHAYILSQAQLNKLKQLSLENFRIDKDQFMVFIPDSDAKTHALEKYQFIDPTDESDQVIAEKYNQNWNKDHFGPLVIPKGKVFVLGDNRDNSMDSRSLGLIDESAITGVYWKTIY